MKCTMIFVHGAPQYQRDTESKIVNLPDNLSKLWAIVTLPIKEECGGFKTTSGYIENFLGLTEIDKEVKYEVTCTRAFLMESKNGGRTNTTEYDTIEDYINDPFVRRMYEKKRTSGMFGMLDYGANPGEVDDVYDLQWDIPLDIEGFEPGSYKRVTFQLESSRYESIAPADWENDLFMAKIGKLRQAKAYSDSTSAIDAQVRTQDLFGDRFFPVLRAPLALKEQMLEACYYFKSHSKPLFDDTYVYIGIRSKVHEIGTIQTIYEEGGEILINREWDW